MKEKRRKIEVVPYNPAWPKEFSRLKKTLSEHLGDLILGIEHVGSTSVPGLAAKPIIDIDIVVEKEKQKEVIASLEDLDYQHRGDLGIAGREAFKNPAGNTFMKHHLYVCPRESTSLKEHLTLRDYLRKNQAAREEYARLKQLLAVKYTYDIERYIEGKTELIRNILKKSLPE